MKLKENITGLIDKREIGVWKEIKRSLLTGILVIGPVMVTAYLLWKSFLFVDGILSKVVNKSLFYFFDLAFLDEYSIPGLGFIALILILAITGFLARNVFGQNLVKKMQGVLNKIPLVNRVYKAIQQISEAILSGRQEVFKSAVIIEYPRPGVYSIAITTTSNGGVVQDCLKKDIISVFVPTTPNPTSGFLLFVPRNEVTHLNISVEDALKLIISGGTVSSSEEPASKNPE